MAALYRIILLLVVVASLTSGRPDKRRPDKRFLFSSKTDEAPVATQQVYYYVIGPDGYTYYVQGGQTLPTQQELASSGGSLLNFLGRPLDALGNIVEKTGDVASSIVNLPFDAAHQVVSGVGLEDTGIGRLANSILDVGNAVLQTPVKVVAGVAEAPFRVAADLAEALKEK